VPSDFSTAEHVNFIAAKVVAHATAYLDHRNDRELLARNAQAVMGELLISIGEDRAAKAILDPTRLLVQAMMGTANAEGEARLDRWRDVMAALVDLVRQEGLQHRDALARRSVHIGGGS
jgi:hypothetical protein